MKRYKLPILLALLIILALAATVQAAGGLELARVRAATAAFHRPEAAVAAGWDTIDNHCVALPGVGGMGYHYINASLMDLEVDATQPEALVYEPRPNGKLRLVAVEWVVPAEPWNAVNSSPPQLLGHAMHYTEPLDAYTLHAWVWRNNPDDMFVDWNPNVTCD